MAQVRIRRSASGSPDPGGYIVSGPASGPIETAATFTASLIPPYATVVVEYLDSLEDGTFDVASLTLTAESPSQEVQYTPHTLGARDIVFTNNRGLPVITKSFTCIPAPSADDQARVNLWLEKARTIGLFHINPALQAGQQLEYDGVYGYWRLSQLFAASHPSDATAFFNHAVWVMGQLYSILPDLIDPNGATGAPGYYTYSLGPLVLSRDSRVSTEDRATHQLACAQYARISTFASNFWWPAYNMAIYNNAAWPSMSDPIQTPWIPEVYWAERELSLGVLAHVVCDDFFDSYESRSQTGGFGTYTYQWAHGEFPWRIAKRHYIDGAWVSWQHVSDLLTAANGDVTQVPECWENSAWSFSPYNFTHAARFLIYFHDDPIFTNDYNSDIVDMVAWMCDCAIEWFSALTPGGRTTLGYRIPDGGTPWPTAAPDLGLFYMPMFAWAYKQTSNATYLTWARYLTDAALNEGFWHGYKQFNQMLLWAYDGFQWLNWVPTIYTTFWRA